MWNWYEMMYEKLIYLKFGFIISEWGFLLKNFLFQVFIVEYILLGQQFKIILLIIWAKFQISQNNTKFQTKFSQLRNYYI
jgi:hypothetical protein